MREVLHPGVSGISDEQSALCGSDLGSNGPDKHGPRRHFLSASRQRVQRGDCLNASEAEQVMKLISTAKFAEFFHHELDSDPMASLFFSTAN